MRITETGDEGLARRVIPCLDVSAGRVVKGVRFRDWSTRATRRSPPLRYAEQGADEIVFLDIGAAPEERDTDVEWVRRTAERVFIPLTVGGGVRSEADAQRLLRSGADKVAINSAAVERPDLVASWPAASAASAWSSPWTPAAEEDGWEVVTQGGRTPRGSTPWPGSARGSSGARARSC